jgi:hypothetical protein
MQDDAISDYFVGDCFTLTPFGAGDQQNTLV